MRPFYIISLAACVMCVTGAPAVAENARKSRGLGTRILPISPTETREFQDASIDANAKILEQQEGIAKELTGISGLLRDIISREEVAQQNARRITPGSAPASMREEISLIRSHLNDLREESEKQTKINIMLVKLMREQVGITRALFAGGQSAAADDVSDIPGFAPEPATPPTSTISDRINVRSAPTKKTAPAATKENTTPGGNTWIVR